jgi:alkanesulfonate monooxygenase SsuD/methylene tetrahydromethanopterin reductase-like flavin-dependent oxidoreductase (luciferase family)
VLLGVNVPNFGPGTDPGMLLEWAQLSEGLGYDAVMISDHVVVTDDVAARYPEPFYDPFTTIAWLSGRTHTIRLGTSVVVLPYRNPLLVARMAANLRDLSGGRFVLGVGAGWSRPEFDALGVSFRRRGALTDQALEIIHDAWSEGTGGPAAPVPVWVGGNGAAALRRCQSFGAAWHPLRATMAELATAAHGPGATGFNPRISLDLFPTPLPDDERALGVGSIEQIIDDLDQLRRLGADTVILDPYAGDPDDTIRPQRAWRALTTVAVHWKDNHEPN